MKTVRLFEKGDKVKVVKDGCNASHFHNISLRGVYDHDWQNLIFEIHGKWEPVNFEFVKNCYGAYLLLLNGEPVGYVYNYALEYVE